MNRLLLVTTCALILLITTSFLSIDVYISGKIYSANSKLNKNLPGIKLIAKYKGKIISQAIADRSGHYEMVINVGLSDGLENTYDFYVTSPHIDTCFIRSFRQFQSEEVTWNIRLPSTCMKKRP